jgi:acyl dehydratase
MGDRSLTLEAYRKLVGQTVGQSEWLLIDQVRINAFADATLDRQYIHVDPERAKASSFGGTIAHGFLTLSLLSYFGFESLPELLDAVAALNYGFERVRFVTPVKCGDRIRAFFKLVEVKEKAPKQFLFCYDATVTIEGQDRPALIAQWLTMHVTA